MSDGNLKQISEKDRDRLFQEFRKLETGEGSEVTGAPKRINAILKSYGSSLADIASNPERLLGASSAQNSEEYQTLYDKFQEAMRANYALAEADAIKTEEIERLRSRRTVYVLNPWNNDLVKQLRKRNVDLIKSEENARRETEQATQRAEQVIQENNVLAPRNRELEIKNKKLELELLTYRKEAQAGILDKFTFKAKPISKSRTIVSKLKSSTAIFKNYGYKNIDDLANDLESGKVRFTPGVLNDDTVFGDGDQTELMFACSITRISKKRGVVDGSSTIDRIINHFLDGDGIPDITVRVEGRYRQGEPIHVAVTASPSIVRRYFEKVGCLVDVKLTDFLHGRQGSELYEMAQIYQEFSSDSNKKKGEKKSTDELVEIMMGDSVRSLSSCGEPIKDRPIEDRLIIMDIYEKLHRPIKNEIYMESTALDMYTESCKIWNNVTTLSIVMGFSYRREPFINNSEIMDGCRLLEKFHNLGGGITENKGIYEFGKHHESAGVILCGGINALTYYVREMGGHPNPSVGLRNIEESVNYEIDMLPEEDKKIYQQLLSEYSLSCSETLDL